MHFLASYFLFYGMNAFQSLCMFFAKNREVIDDTPWIMAHDVCEGEANALPLWIVMEFNEMGAKFFLMHIQYDQVFDPSCLNDIHETWRQLMRGKGSWKHSYILLVEEKFHLHFVITSSIFSFCFFDIFEDIDEVNNKCFFQIHRCPGEYDLVQTIYITSLNWFFLDRIGFNDLCGLKKGHHGGLTAAIFSALCFTIHLILNIWGNQWLHWNDLMGPSLRRTFTQVNGSIGLIGVTFGPSVSNMSTSFLDGGLEIVNSCHGHHSPWLAATVGSMLIYLMGVKMLSLEMRDR